MSTDTEAASILSRSVQSLPEAESLVKHILDVMDALDATINDETRLVRAGKLGEAAKIERTKAELSRLYLADAMRIRASRPYLAQTAPDALASLRKRHEDFQARLQTNLTVLGTAHAVAEGIMRGVSDELARKATPHGYGATGRASVPSASSRQPLTISRVL